MYLLIKKIKSSLVSFISIIVCLTYSNSFAINKTIYPDGAVGQLLILHAGHGFGSCVGGFIVSTHLITAAHCIEDPVTDKPGVVYVQQPNLDNIPLNPDAGKQLIPAKSFVINPNYNGFLSDLAIITLPSPVTLPDNDKDKILSNGDLSYWIKQKTGWDTNRYLTWNAYTAQIFLTREGREGEIIKRVIKLNTRTAHLYAGDAAKKELTSIYNTLQGCGIFDYKIDRMIHSSETEFDNFIYDITIGAEAKAASGDSGHPLLGYLTTDKEYWYLDGIFHGRLAAHECGGKHYTIDLYTNTYPYGSWIDSEIGHSRQKRSTDFSPNAPNQFTHTILYDQWLHFSAMTITSGNSNSGFIGGNNTLGIPDNLSWYSSRDSTKFTVMLSDNTGKKYKVHMWAQTRNGCTYNAIGNAISCKDNPNRQTWLFIGFDNSLNQSLPKSIQLQGQFTLNRVQWQNKNNTNIHVFNIRWTTPS